MIWTTMPEEILFDMPEKDIKECLKIVRYNRRQVLVDTTGMDSGDGRITRLFSSCPADFLDKQFSPGNIIRYK